MDRVRKYAAQMELNDAVERAITECIQEGILSEFLQQNRAEVYKVSIFEYDKEKEEKKLRKAEYEHGLEDGISIGKEDGITIGKEAGRQEGITIGKAAGKQEGRLEGIAEGESKLIVKMYKNGFKPEQIASAIDKSVDEIREILSKKMM